MVWTKKNRKEYYEKNKEKFHKYSKKYREEHKESIKELNKKYREEHKEKLKIWNQEYRKKHLQELIKNQKEYYEKNKEKRKEYEHKRFKKYRKEIKMKVFNHYGTKCKCCGENKQTMLTIDHINNDGAEHRSKIGGSSKIYRWLIDNNFPRNFQTLCFNCNISKELNGTCEHKSQVQEGG